MNLSFSQNFKKDIPVIGGKQTHFVEKIWNCFSKIMKQNEMSYYGSKLEDRGIFPFERDFLPKIHTIRHDKNNRWKAGNDIHFIINNRTKNRFQFAPIVRCTGVQKIKIEWDCWNKFSDDPYDKNPLTVQFDDELKERCVLITIDGKRLNRREVIRLAENDGFDCVDHFLLWFNKDFQGKIIHWTNLKY